jgi:hypothetical protein
MIAQENAQNKNINGIQRGTDGAASVTTNPTRLSRVKIMLFSTQVIIPIPIIIGFNESYSESRSGTGITEPHSAFEFEVGSGSKVIQHINT